MNRGKRKPFLEFLRRELKAEMAKLTARATSAVVPVTARRFRSFRCLLIFLPFSSSASDICDSEGGGKNGRVERENGRYFSIKIFEMGDRRPVTLSVLVKC